jgi:hypothetical protein
VRRSSLGLALSAAAHVAAAAGWLAWPPSRRVAAAELELRSSTSPAPQPASPRPPVPEDQVIELAIVELPSEVVEELAAVAPSPQRPLARQEREISTRATAPLGAALVAGATDGATEAPPSEAPPGEASSRSSLSMRNALPTRLVVPDLRKIADRGPTVALAQPAPMSEELEPAGGGRFRSDQAAFTAKVNRDGTVVFDDKPNFNVSIADPRDVGKAVKKGLADWAKNPYAQTRDREREAEQHRVPSGAVDDEEEQRKRPKTVTVLSGSFDLTDWAMRLAGRDPYWAAKLAFMDRTRESRAQLAVSHRAELLRSVVTMVRDQAKQAWADPTQTAAQRRRALFELWDDCAEASAEAGAKTSDDPLVEAARRARVALYGFIRAKAPAGGPDAYSAEELAALNRARHSRQAFAPYDDLPSPAP